MADPTSYTPGYSFTDYQASNPDEPLPAPQVDSELADISAAIIDHRAAIMDVRRSDGALQNEIVTFDSLAPEVAAQIGTGIEAALEDAEAAAAAAAASATSASGFATAASGYATAADVSADAAAASAAGVAAIFADFDTRYLGPKAVAPTLDNQGNALIEGALYWNTVTNLMMAYDGAAWGNFPIAAGSITATEIATGAVGTLEILDGAVTAAKLDADEAAAIREVLEVSPRFYRTNVAYDYTNQNIIVRNGMTDGYHRHFGGIARGIKGRLHLVYRRAAEHAWTALDTLYYCNSDDGGKTWSAESALVTPISGYDTRAASICVTPTGRVLVVYGATDGVANAGQTLLKLGIRYSDDNGVTWSSGTDVANISTGYGLSYGRIAVLPANNADGYKLIFTEYHKTGSGPNTYKIACWYSEDDGLSWTEGTPIYAGLGGYNETEVVGINAYVYFAVSRGSGLNLSVSTDGGATWSMLGAVPTTDGVAPSLDKFRYRGKWYLLLAYCDRSTNQTILKYAAVSDAVLSATTSFSSAIVTASDMVNASGYQTTILNEDGTVDLDGGLGLLEFKEYNAGTISGITQANPAVVTTGTHGFTTGDTIKITGVVGMTQVNGLFYTITVLSPTTFSLNGVNSTGYTAYSSGGTAYKTESQVRLARFDFFGNFASTSVDEEIGSWVPVPYGATTPGSPTGTFDGTYRKVGKKVEFTGRVTFTSLSTMAGVFRIDGLPYVCRTGAQNRGPVTFTFFNARTNDFAMVGFVEAGTNDIYLYQADTDADTVNITDLSATTTIQFGGWYLTA